MRKANHTRRQFTKSTPMIVHRFLNKNKEGAREFALFVAFNLHIADEDHYNRLCDMANLVLIANDTKPTKFGENLAKNLVLLTNRVKERFNRVGKYGANDQELRVLEQAIYSYEQFWNGQPDNRYNEAVAELKAFHFEKQMKDKGEIQ